MEMKLEVRSEVDSSSCLLVFISDIYICKYLWIVNVMIIISFAVIFIINTENGK